MPQQEESMRVVVRMRPPSEQDGDSSNKPTIDSVGRKISVLRDRKGTAEFSFSSVLGEESKQEDLYDVCRDSVSYVMDGINCCILAYGQTGSGKTYSMLGKGWEDPNFVVSGDSDQLQPPGIFNDDEYGIIPR
jgi:kinesin family protein 15